MTGYEVVTSDEHTIGTVVEDRGEYLIVERGMLRKTRHALPKAFAHADGGERIVRVTVSKETIADSPKLAHGEIDEQAVARHYGLAGGWEHPDTEGRGDVLPGDPAVGSEVEGQQWGVEPADKERAEIREGHRDEAAPHVRERMPNANDPFGQTANRR
jgi:hypothetical protein